MAMPGPDTYVVELRVPGAGSASPEAVVGGVAAVDVAGDGVGRLLRPADRLLRPAPGPVLSSTGRPVPRTVEGYCWAAMAPRGPARAAWALLLPFTLVNAAHWMLPPVTSAGVRGSLRALLRVSGVLLTMMLAAQLSIAAHQLPTAPGVLGLLPVLLAVLVMHRGSRVRWTAPAAAGTEPGAAEVGAGLSGDPDAAALRALHTTAALATVALLAAGGLGLRWLPDPATVVTDIGVLLAATVTLTALLLVAAARAAGPRWRALPRELRPWAGGWAAVPVLALAGLLGTGLGAGLALAVRGLAGPGGWPLPSWYRPLLEGWGAAALLLTVAAPVVGLVMRSRWRRAGTAAELRALHSDGLPAGVTGAWRRATVLHRSGHRLLGGATGVLLLACLLAGLGPIGGPAALALVGDGLVAIGAVALAAVAVTVTAAAAGVPRRATGTSRLAVLLELVSCWPRKAHPIVAPCPAPKAVPELVARAETHLADPGARVVLTGQGYGSVLVTVAAARLVQRLDPGDRERVGLLTAGAPLQWGHARAFPAVFPQHDAARLAGALQGRWRALCRGTDPGGSAVTTRSRQLFDDRLLGTGLRPDGTAGALPAARRGTHGALVLGGDHWVPDPQHAPVDGRRWRAGILGAADYPSDPEWEAAVALAAGLVTPTATALPKPGGPVRDSAPAAGGWPAMDRWPAAAGRPAGAGS